MSDLDKSKIESRKEIVIPITLKGLIDGYKKIFHDAPAKGFQWFVRKMDDAAQKMLTGHVAILSMPLGIMVRNGARVAHAASKDSYFASSLSGVAAAGLGFWYGWGFLAAKAAAVPMIASFGAFATSVAGAIAALPVMVPAYSAGMLVGSAALGLGATALSVVPAIINLPRAALRSWDRIKGVKYSDKDLEVSVDEDGLSRRYEQQRLSKAYNVVGNLSIDSQKEIAKYLSSNFEKAAAKEEAAKAKAAAAVAAVAPAAEDRKMAPPAP